MFEKKTDKTGKIFFTSFIANKKVFGKASYMKQRRQRIMA
jgi:hypothetical protein